jgi:ubiquinone/menaquinone biosynthesis C-methylase UbiE
MAVIRDSGMPEEEYWNSFFNIEDILDVFQVGPEIDNVVDIGSGYGTFTLPVAKRIGGVIYAIDIETILLSNLFTKALKLDIRNLIPRCRDIVEQGTGCKDSSIDLVLLFNILHCQHPEVLLEEAFRVLSPGGRLAVMHWVPLIKTPRGPDLPIRPTPEKCIEWATRCGFLHSVDDIFNFKPWHYGLDFSKPEIKHD